MGCHATHCHRHAWFSALLDHELWREVAEIDLRSGLHDENSGCSRFLAAADPVGAVEQAEEGFGHNAPPRSHPTEEGAVEHLVRSPNISRSAETRQALENFGVKGVGESRTTGSGKPQEIPVRSPPISAETKDEGSVRISGIPEKDGRDEGPRPGEYAEGELPVQDHDSNGWPQSGRNKALRAMRKGFAFHIAGDQHLGSTIQYGIDTWGDAGWALCVPSVANIWPRRWFPPEPGGNHQDGTPRYTGDYLDGFGNKMTVHAVSNPTANGVEPTAIHHRTPGYGIVTLDRDTREITFANWPRWVDPSEPDALPYPGWPISVDQLANGFPAEGWRLETIETEIDDPVIQIATDASGEVVYTYRIQGRSFEPRVFEGGVYTVRVTDPDSDYEEIYAAILATRSP